MSQDILPEAKDTNVADADVISILKLENEKLQEQLSTIQSKFAVDPSTKETEYSKACTKEYEKKNYENIASDIAIQLKEQDFLLSSIRNKLSDSGNTIDMGLLESTEGEVKDGYKTEELLERLKFYFIHAFLRDESFEGDDDLAIPLKKILEHKKFVPSISKEVNKLYLPAKGIANKALRAKKVATHEKQLGQVDSNSDLDMSNPVHVHLAFSRGKIKGEDYDLFRKNLKKRG